jgi:SAM-dependent methyltransferase
MRPGVFGPRLKSWMWLRWYNFMAARFPQAHWTMMNYGYEPAAGGGGGGGGGGGVAGDGGVAASAQRPELSAAEEWERYSIQMYRHVAAAAGLPWEGTGGKGGKAPGAGKARRPFTLADCTDVLEVGCGRGGGLAWLASRLRGGDPPAAPAAPTRCVGLDFSPVQVSFCTRRHAALAPGGLLSFVAGDACALPFGAGSFDAVLSVESSHCYPDMGAFLAESARVLRPGGLFLFADFRDAGAEDEAHVALLRGLRPAGLALRHEEDITPRVLAALDLDHDRKVNDCLSKVPAALRGFVEMFIGTKGSKTYRNFVDGRWVYRYFVLQKEA